MNFLRKLLGLMLTLLLVIVLIGGGLLYYQNYGSPFGHLAGQHGDQNAGQTNDTSEDNKVQDQVRVPTQQEIAQIHIAFLNQYIEEINQSLKLVNEANGLITSDPFFANPPVISKDKTGGETPFDTQTPQVPTPEKPNQDTNTQNQSPVFLPDYYFYYYQQNMQNVHRGIYKLAQGMTLMNQVVEKMNRDVGRLNTNPTYLPPQNFQPYNFPWGFLNPNYYGMQVNPQTGTMPTNGQAMTHTTGAGVNMQTITTGLYMFVLLMFLVSMIAIGGYLLSLFRKRTQS